METSTKIMESFNITLPLGRNWDVTVFIQEAVWNFAHCVFMDRSLADSVSMVSTELVENAIKFSDPDTMDEPIEFKLKGNKKRVLIEVINRIKDPDGQNVAMIDETIQWIRGYQNPYEAYVERLKLVARVRDEQPKLGMVRIAYEGNAIIDFFLGDDNRISISATIPLG